MPGDLFLFLLKKLLEEHDLITDGVVPIGTVMTARTGGEIVAYFL